MIFGKPQEKPETVEKPKPEAKQNAAFKYIIDIGKTTINTSLEVLFSLDQAAAQVGSQVGQSATQIVRKKYGDDAASIVQEGALTIGQLNQAYTQVKRFGVKSVAKNTAVKALFDQPGQPPN